MENSERNWWIRRLQGELAESIAEIHFRAMGYVVEKSGIEYQYPAYTHDSVGHSPLRDFLGEHPDFIVYNRDSDIEFMVEVKARYTQRFSFYDLEKEILWNYRRVLFNSQFYERITREWITADMYLSNKTYDQLSFDERNAFDKTIKKIIGVTSSSRNWSGSNALQDFLRFPVFFYLLIVPPRADFSREEPSYVYIYNPYLAMWQSPSRIQEERLEFRGIEEGRGFNDIYQDIIKPYLETIISNSSQE